MVRERPDVPACPDERARRAGRAPGQPAAGPGQPLSPAPGAVAVMGRLDLVGRQRGDWDRSPMTGCRGRAAAGPAPAGQDGRMFGRQRGTRPPVPALRSARVAGRGAQASQLVQIGASWVLPRPRPGQERLCGWRSARNCSPRPGPHARRGAGRGPPAPIDTWAPPGAAGAWASDDSPAHASATSSRPPTELWRRAGRSAAWTEKRADPNRMHESWSTLRSRRPCRCGRSDGSAVSRSARHPAVLPGPRRLQRLPRSPLCTCAAAILAAARSMNGPRHHQVLLGIADQVLHDPSTQDPRPRTSPANE